MYAAVVEAFLSSQFSLHICVCVSVCVYVCVYVCGCVCVVRVKDEPQVPEGTSQQLKSLKLVDETTAETCSVSARDRKPPKSKAMSKFCGRMHVLKKELCPAWGKVCSACKKRNRFALKCMKTRPKKSLHLVENDSESEDEELLYVGNEQPEKVIKAEMIIKGETVVCQRYSGASVNVTPLKNSVLEKRKTKLHMYNDTVIRPKGKTQLMLKNPKNVKKFKAEFVVVEEDFTPLLGKVTSEKMGLITVHYENFKGVSKIAVVAVLLSGYSDVFDDDQGSLPGVAHFAVDETVIPVISPACPVPHTMKSKVKAELQKLMEREIITPIEEPTSWCSRMVVVTKNFVKATDLCYFKASEQSSSERTLPSTCHESYATQAIQCKSLLKTKPE